MRANSPSALLLNLAVAGFFVTTLFSHTVAARLLLLFFATGLALLRVGTQPSAATARLVSLPPAWIAFLLWAIWAGLSIFWSGEPERASKEFRNEIIYAGMAYWTCFIAGQSRAGSPWSIGIVALGLVCSTLLSIGVGFQLTPTAIQQWHGGPGAHSSVLLVMAPLVFIAWWQRNMDAGAPRRALNASVMTMTVLILVSAYATLNRTIWLGFVLQLIVTVAALYGNQLQSFRTISTANLKRLGGFIVAVIMCVALFILTTAQRSGIEEITRDVRLGLWHKALLQLMDSPWVGYGFGRGNFRVDWIQAYDSNGLIWHSHNLLIETAIQTGVIGLALLLYLFTKLLLAGIQLTRRADAQQRVWGAAILAIVLGMLVRNFTDVLWVRGSALLFWGALGVVFGWAQAQITSTRQV